MKVGEASSISASFSRPMMPLAAGFDVAYGTVGDTQYGFGACALFTAPDRSPCVVETIQMPTPEPDRPGRLARREMPLLHAIWQRLPRKPQVLFIDGAGHMHPERRGFATVAGEALGVRTVGVVKDPYIGDLESPVGGPDDAVPVRDGSSFIGYAWRPHPPAVQPLYVSVGSALPPVGALALVRAWTRKGHALPEPIRVADACSKRLRDQVLAPETV